MLKLDEARQFLTEAQRIADKYGIQYYAQKVSNEHDKLLEKLETWESLKKTEAPVSQRLELSAVDTDLEYMLTRRTITPPEVVEEEPIVIFIMAKGGVPVFTHSFTNEWKRDTDIFGSFLSAFTSFSDEFFSKGLDRAKFGEDTILIQAAGKFSICYLFKGQSYLANQKIAKFTEGVQNSASIWQTINRFYETSQFLEIGDNFALESLVSDIFIGKSPKINA